MTSAARARAVIGALVLILATAWGATAAEPGSASKAAPPIACGSIYQVKQGDWLTRIARRAYGEADYLTIYRANRDVLPNLSVLPVGVRLFIPCRDGTGPSTRAEAEAMKTPDALAAEADALADQTDALAAEADALVDETDTVSAESDAQVVETDAQVVETDAQVVETDALALETDAQAVETDAQAVETDVQTAESDAQTAESDAQGAAIDAETDIAPEPEVAETALPAAAPPPVIVPPPTTEGMAALPSAPEPEISAAPAQAEIANIKLVSGRDFPPFADPGLPHGGMIGDLVKRSLEIAAPGRPTPKIFLDDLSEHLKLLESGAFDISFPWFKPDCTRADRLTGIMRQVCSGFVFSNPLYEVDMRIYVRTDSPLVDATAPDALFGKRLCRPAGQFTFDLEQAGLFEPNLTRVIPPTAGDCFAWLVRGDVDAVSIDGATGAAEIRHLGREDQVVPVAALDSALTLHVIAADDRAKGRASIDLIDAGLSELQMSGTWFEVVAYHRGAYAVSTR